VVKVSNDQKKVTDQDAEKMAEAIRENFSEIFLATSYATKDDRKYALLQCLEPNKEYTVKELTRIFVEKYKIPISRVAINSYINQLEAEEKVVFERKGLGGSKIVSLTPY